MRLDEVPTPELKPRHVLAQVLCVQPSVTEAQLVAGIRTLAFDRIKKRLETEAPVQLFGHEFCACIVEVGEGVTRFKPCDRVASRAKLPCENCNALHAKCVLIDTRDVFVSSANFTDAAQERNVELDLLLKSPQTAVRIFGLRLAAGKQ